MTKQPTLDELFKQEQERRDRQTAFLELKAANDKREKEILKSLGQHSSEVDAPDLEDLSFLDNLPPDDDEKADISATKVARKRDPELTEKLRDLMRVARSIADQNNGVFVAAQLVDKLKDRPAPVNITLSRQVSKRLFILKRKMFIAPEAHAKDRHDFHWVITPMGNQFIDGKI